MTRTTPVALPAPTADELAAIRARLDGRRARRRLRTRWPLALAIAAVAVLVWQDMPADVGTELVEWRRAWPLLATAMACEIAHLLRTVVRLDEDVMRRLSAAGSGREPDGRRTLGVRTRAGLVVAVSGAPVAWGCTGWAASRGGPVVTWWSFAALSLALATGGIALAVIARRRGIGTGPVMEAVDRAIRHDDLRTVVRVAGIAVVPGVFVLGPALGGVPPVVAVLVYLPFLLAMLLIDVDERLFRDFRLPDAEPPESWLAHAAVA